MLTLGASWFEIFKPFTTFHFVVAAICFALTAGACVIGIRLRGTPAEFRFRLAWASLIVAAQLFADAWRLFFRDGAPPDGDLPLQVCRIAPWFAVGALLTGNRVCRAVLYFWGLGLCFQGLVTPMRFDAGLASMDFWLFWIGHLQIVGSAFYDLVAHAFRPTARDLRTALIASAIYAAVILPLNAAFDWDYGYLGRGPYRTRNIIDHLGDWPWRPVWLILIACAWQAVLLAIWRVPGLARYVPPAPYDAEAPKPSRVTS